MACMYSLKKENDIDSPNSNESSDSLSTLINSPYNNSQDRSSVGSIPWAQDAIKQNQSEWEKIERIFYGEEDLPTDHKTREEFLDWMIAFPHLRVNGKPAPIYYDPNFEGEDEFFEEIIAIHPTRYHTQNLLNYYPEPDHYYSRKDHKKTEHSEERSFRRHKSRRVKKSSAVNANIENLNNEITKYLKISPSPVLKRRYSNKTEKESINIISKIDQPARLQFDPKNPYYLKIPSKDNSVRLINVKNQKFVTSNSSSNLVSTKFQDNTIKASQSASNIRMPPILNFQVQQKTNLHVKSAVVKLNRETTLPTLKESDLSDISTNMRAISAVQTHSNSLFPSNNIRCTSNIKIVKFN